MVKKTIEEKEKTKQNQGLPYAPGLHLSERLEPYLQREIKPEMCTSQWGSQMELVPASLGRDSMREKCTVNDHRDQDHWAQDRGRVFP